ncbi:MAG: HIT domain-containing protein [bacterium]|nr:HIT domain-containing protein [bacterium]
MPDDTNPAENRPIQLHAPWRDRYMQMLSDQAASETGGEPVRSSCFIREYWLNPGDDETNHVIVRTGRPKAPTTQGDWSRTDADPETPGGMVFLNRYPYANGHLLVALGESRPRLLDYTPEQRSELWSLVDLATDLCERTLGCQGVNIGINQGLAAGAGVPEHLHVHVVPRWHGDVNFISVVGQVRVIPGAIEAMAQRYREMWEKIRPE